ncbi:MAG: glycosyltransferase [Lachnospiraceae bacterium]|nr:glycosyltransferase [Lachnospiraceae bacterium]
MSVYIFSLLAGFVFGGVDTAQGYRAGILENLPYPVKFIFESLPRREDIIRYKNIGIKLEQMLCMHQCFTGNLTVKLCGKTKDKLEELKKCLRCTGIEQHENEVRLIRKGALVASILLDEENKDYYWGIHYFNRSKLIRTEIYTDGISYTNYYVTARSDKGAYAKLVRRTFYSKGGEAVYDQIFERNREWYLFPDGRCYTKQQFLAAFIRKLDLKEKDIIILDRPASYDLLRPIFQFKGMAKLVVIMHSGHFYEKGEDPYDVYLNKEYYYCFKYSGMINAIVVSTEEQKCELVERLQEYGCAVPEIRIIPAGGVDSLKCSEKGRQPYSMLSVSRIHRRKKVEWVIKSVIKAHKKNPNIFVDIYGEGVDKDYYQYLHNIVSQNEAQSYVRFMGWTDVTEIYKNYEVYITASLWETLGLSLMEAVASGTAMIGLDAKYGNRLFIQPENNGYLVEFHTEYVDGDDDKLTDAIAEKIVDIFSDETRLREYHNNSYRIAQTFCTNNLTDKWEALLNFWTKGN